jgi:hypothetical protein
MPSGNPGSRQTSSSDRHTLAPVKLIDNEAIAALVVRLIWGQSYEFTTKPPALCMYSRLYIGLAPDNVYLSCNFLFS